MEENKAHIDEILEEVHQFQEEDKTHHSKTVIYEGKFRLTKAEVYEGLIRLGVIRKEIRKSLIYSILIVLGISGFLYAYSIKGNANNLIFAVLSFVVLVAVWIIPKRQISALARRNLHRKPVSFTVYETHLVIADDNKRYCIHLDNTSRLKESKHLLIVQRLRDDVLFVIPLKAIERSEREKVVALFRNGMLNLKT